MCTFEDVGLSLLCIFYNIPVFIELAHMYVDTELETSGTNSLENFTYDNITIRDIIVEHLKNVDFRGITVRDILIALHGHCTECVIACVTGQDNV